MVPSHRLTRVNWRTFSLMALVVLLALVLTFTGVAEADSCATGDHDGDLYLVGDCTITGDVDGNIKIKDGTLTVAGELDGNIQQMGAGSVVILGYYFRPGSVPLSGADNLYSPALDHRSIFVASLFPGPGIHCRRPPGK